MFSLFVYNLLLALTSPLLLVFLFSRQLKGKEDTKQWDERWGKLPETVSQDTRKPRFWVHAVSVGEVMAAIPVLRELRRQFPDAYILLSTTTTGGREVALKQVPPADEVVYYPLDFPAAVTRALDDARPDVILLMEWEIWPNFLTEAEKRGVKIAVLNGRVSDKGLRLGSRVAFFTRPGLDAVTLFAMQSEEDARRAALVGAQPRKVQAFGNTKFDEAVTPLSAEERSALRRDLGIPEGAPVWICGSTRNAPEPGTPDEEAFIAEAFLKVREKFPDLHLIVAPRHLERADEAAAAFKKLEVSVVRRSSMKKKAPPAPNNGGAGKQSATASSVPPLLGARGPSSKESILLLDTFGELGRAYAVADVAFIGGSLVKWGGQSVFQPLAQGVPAIFGPHMSNQRDIAALSKAEKVGFQVANAAELATEVIRLLSLTPGEKQEIATQARGLIERNQGVSARSVEAVAQLLDTAER
jgi:3-deoxy-D-manno-octulosonic-acid transferase